MAVTMCWLSFILNKFGGHHAKCTSDSRTGLMQVYVLVRFIQLRAVSHDA